MWSKIKITGMIKNIGKVVLLLLIIILSVAACKKDKKKVDNTLEFPIETQNLLNAVIDQKQMDYEVPGIIAGAWVPGRGIWINTTGKSDLVTGVNIQEYEKVRIADITKTFTATIILQLVDEGVISLDDFLDQIITTNVPNADKITIKHLCNMTSGLFNYSDDSAFVATLANDPLKKWDPQELINIAVSHPAYSAPGLEWHYSNTNYIVLGLVVEQIIGVSLENVIDERIFEPFKFTSSSFPLFPNFTGEYSHGYLPLGPDSLLEDFTLFDPSSTWAAGGIVSNLFDLHDWSKILATGALLTDSIQSLRMDWKDANSLTDPYLFYGLGLMNEGNFIGYYGEIPGYEASMFYLFSEDASIVVLTNRTSDHNVSLEVFRELAAVLFPKEVVW